MVIVTGYPHPFFSLLLNRLSKIDFPRGLLIKDDAMVEMCALAEGPEKMLRVNGNSRLSRVDVRKEVVQYQSSLAHTIGR